MPDSVSVTSHHSYGSRVGSSFKAILWGIILVWISIWLLAWNENRYVKTKAGINEWNKAVQETISTQINPDLEEKEVHLYGELASNEEILQDNTFWIVTNDLKLKRTVEMYQWYEDEHEECHDNYWWSEDCTTTYTYDTKWSNDAISSSDFHSRNGHENPSTWEYESNERIKEPITLWVYTLNSVFVNQLTDYKTINLSEQDITIPEKYRWTIEEISQTDEETTVEENNNSYLYWDSQEENNTTTISTSHERFHVNGDQIYIWLDPAKPTVWDLKITFSSVKPSTISIVWKQIGNELTTYTTSNGTTIAYLEQWNVSADDMFLHAQQANKQITWILRLIWLLLMYCGFAAIFKFIETLAKVIPFLAKIIWVWTGIIALSLTLIVWFITIGIGWLVVRPIIGICCLIVAAWGIFLLKKSKKAKNDDLPKQKTIEEKSEPIEVE